MKDKFASCCIIGWSLKINPVACKFWYLCGCFIGVQACWNDFPIYAAQ